MDKKVSMNFAVSRPCSGSNAVEVAILYVAFAEPLGESVLKVLQEFMAARFADSLPGEERGDAQTFQMQLPMGAVQAQPSPVPGASILHEIARFHSQPNGRPSKKLRAIDTTVSFECFKYENFQHFQAEVQNYLAALLQNIPADLRVNEVGFVVEDRFLFDEPLAEENYSVAELFRENSRYLTPAIYENGPLWHVFQGWFEGWDGNECRLLNQLNVSNTLMQTSGAVYSRIEHRVLFRPISISLTLEDILNKYGLSDILRHAHAANVRVLKELLNDNKLEKIGMRK